MQFSIANLGITFRFKVGHFWPVTGDFPTQRTCNAENASIWWRPHVDRAFCSGFYWLLMYIIQTFNICLNRGFQYFCQIRIIFSEVLSVSPRVLTSEISFVLKDLYRIVNFDNWRWVWNWYSVVKKIHFRFVQNIVHTINSVHVTKFGMQKDSVC